MIPVSDALKGLLHRQGMSTGTVGAGKVVLNKSPGAAMDGARGGVLATGSGGGPNRSPLAGQGGEAQPIRVAIATSKWRIVRTRPLLMIMDGMQ